MTESTTERRVPTDEELPRLLEELEREGGNLAEFARVRGLAPWRLYRARRAARGSEGVAARVEGSRHSMLREVRVRDEGGSTQPLEVVLRGGRRVMVPDGFEAASLRRLLGVLESC